MSSTIEQSVTMLDDEVSEETWANMLLPERVLGCFRWPLRAEARQQADSVERDRGRCFVLTEAGPVAFDLQTIVQVRLR